MGKLYAFTAVIFIFIFTCIILKCPAQNRISHVLKGVVRDEANGRVLEGVTITLSDIRMQTITDADGRYQFKGISSGHTTVEVSHVGYSGIAYHLDIESDSTIDFSMRQSVIENQAVTVTAVGAAISSARVPVQTIRIGRRELLAGSATNIIDALSRQPGISQITTGPAISKPQIRGLGYNRVVVINDGMRQEGQQWGDEHGIEIDDNSVNKIEIVKGPASLLYGSDALAGVINIMTNQMPAINTFKAEVLSGYMTNNKLRSLYAQVGAHKGSWGWNAWMHRKQAADYKNVWDGPVFNSKFNELNFGGMLGYNGSWGFSHLTLTRFNQQLGVVEGDRNDSGQFITQSESGTEILPSSSDFNSIIPRVPYQSILHDKIISETSIRAGGGKINLLAGYQRNQRMEFGNPENTKEKSLYFDLPTLSYRLSYQFREAAGWSVSCGINGMHQQNSNKGQEALIPEYTLADAGVYVYASKSLGRSTWSGGLRYDTRQVRTKASDNNTIHDFPVIDRRFSNVSGSVGISYPLDDRTILKCNVSKGFRAPNMPELASRGAHEGTNRFEYGNPNLTSESSLQSEVSLDINSSHLSFYTSVFINSIRNFIYYRKLLNANGTDSLVLSDGEELQAFTFNQQSALLYGWESKLDFHPHPIDWLHWEVGFSWVRGQFDDEVDVTRNLPLMPAPRILSQLRAELLPKGRLFRDLSAFVEYDHNFRQNRAFTAFGTETITPSFGLLNAGINFSLMSKKTTICKVFIVGSNLGDIGYQQHLSRLKYTAVNPVTGRQGVFNMGRNFSIRLNFPFSFQLAKG